MITILLISLLIALTDPDHKYLLKYIGVLNLASAYASLQFKVLIHAVFNHKLFNTTLFVKSNSFILRSTYFGGLVFLTSYLMVDLRGLASVDYRGLASFCREFENHCRMNNSPHAQSDQNHFKPSQSSPNCHHKTKKSTALPSCPSLCEQSSAAVLDIIFFFLVLGSCGILFTPYLIYACKGASEFLPATFLYITEVVYEAPVAYVCSVLLTFVSVMASWEVYQYKSRKCRNRYCKGLRKSVEFDIQLETEECIKSRSAEPQPLPWNRGVELTQDQKELEWELKRIAPPNGRAVLIYRAPCGCPAARFEVWAPKKARKAKK